MTARGSTATEEDAEALLRALVAIPSVNPRDGQEERGGTGDGGPGVQGEGAPVTQGVGGASAQGEDDGAGARDEGGETAVARFVRDWLARRGVQATLEEVLPGRCNVVAVVPGRDERAVLLESHLDTVETDGMTVEPYAGEVRDGRLYGRGACDAKGPLAALMLAAAELARGEPPAYSVVLAGVCDEEHAYRGVLGLLEQLGGRKVVGAIVGEPTGLAPVTAHKGVVRYTVRTTGQAGHSSRPEDAANAVSLMAPVIAHIDATAPGTPPHRMLGAATRCVTRIRGGTGPNTVPGICEVDVDRRTLPGEEPMEVWRQDRAELTALGGPLEVDAPFTVDHALDTPPTSPVVAALCRVLADHGLPPTATGMPFGTDASKIARAGIPSVVFGPGSVTDAHSAAESVALADVTLASHIVAATVRRLAPTQEQPDDGTAAFTEAVARPRTEPDDAEHWTAPSAGPQAGPAPDAGATRGPAEGATGPARAHGSTAPGPTCGGTVLTADGCRVPGPASRGTPPATADSATGRAPADGGMVSRPAGSAIGRASADGSTGGTADGGMVPRPAGSAIGRASADGSTGGTADGGMVPRPADSATDPAAPANGSQGGRGPRPAGSGAADGDAAGDSSGGGPARGGSRHPVGRRQARGAVRLNEYVTLVGSGAAGFDLTDPLDCHVYLVRGAQRAALIDAGAGRSADGILRNAADAGAPEPEYLLLTHGHADHAGGAAALAARLPALRVLAGTPAHAWIAEGDETRLSLDRGKAAGVYPPDYTFAPCPVAAPLADGEEIDLGGDVVLRALATPGHADGHLCYLLTAPGHRALFSGDCVFTGGRISLQNLHDCRVPEYAASLTRLATLDIDALFPGHHEISLARAGRHLQAAGATVAHGLLPRSTT
ncbi:M20/M25/M40 family metallo-hydrolase [Streptomyces sp. NPDC002896]|uniref:M20/M25/M40 family metallo-hydrolase n=1 Tax=Streptomyces sp. NPDC002896 TaxID=3154438 RepID=UPI00332CE352